MNSSTSNRAQLNDYFASELANLRTRAIEFATENPSIAEELMLNSNNEGKSRDPHIEILIQSFAWLTSRLRQNIESESSKLPALLLQQMYPQLICSTPSMAIAQFSVKDADVFETGYTLNGKTLLEPVGLNQDNRQTAKLQQCKFSSCYDTVLWPLKVTGIKTLSINDLPDIPQQFHGVQSVLEVSINEIKEGMGKNTRFENPLRFFINLEENMRFKFYDYLCKHCIGARVFDQTQTRDSKPLAMLSAQDVIRCGFEDNERLFPIDSHQDLGFSLLQDYFSFPEKFMFFELKGMAHVSAKHNLRIQFVFDEALPKSIKLKSNSFQLNCAPVINLFPKTTEPLPIHYKDYRFKLFPSRQYYDCFEVVSVNKVYSVNKQGETHELTPYFSFHQNEKASSCRWMVQSENSHRKHISGAETWLSLFDTNFENHSPLGDTLFAETWCCNRSVCENFNKSQQFGVIGSSPVERVSLITRPTRHTPAQINKEHLWQLLSHLSPYYISLTDEVLAKDILTRFLGLYANKDNPVSQRQIDSIERLDTADDVQPHIGETWRGYYRGTKFTLTLTERKFDGISPLLFGGVIHQFLALFCHINSFVRLELQFGNRSVYQWQPMSGHRMLV